MSNRTNEILSKIMETAGVDQENFSGPDAAILRLLRYYRQDIPASPRYLYDGDAVSFYHDDAAVNGVQDEKSKQWLAERGDVMTSLWVPLTTLLGMNNGRVAGKSDDNIDYILSRYQEGDPKVLEAFEMMRYLAEHYFSRGNLLLLPDMCNEFGAYKMNPDKFRISEDKVDQFLWRGWNGKTMAYFDYNYDYMTEWILSEHLECMYYEGFFEHSLEEIESSDFVIDTHEIKFSPFCLQSMIGDWTRIPAYDYRELTDSEWHLYFDSLAKVIAYRNKQHFQPHLPYKFNA